MLLREQVPRIPGGTLAPPLPCASCLLSSQGIGVSGGKLDGKDSLGKVQEENQNLKADLKKLKDELAANKQSESWLVKIPVCSFPQGIILVLGSHTLLLEWVSFPSAWLVVPLYFKGFLFWADLPSPRHLPTLRPVASL